MAHADVELESRKHTFGGEVYELLHARFGQPVLGNYQDIQKLKSADRIATIALLFGPDASVAGRLREAQPDEVVNEFANRVEQAKHAIQEGGKTELKGTVFSGLLQMLGEGLAALG